ncbi:MAG TPA: isoprenylcysteine carboxylmethyltransferase family protein [Anaeromyxobacter sp.]|nr:isoprenylcysteine carboxylmethyltransferase family protein [Anaeromyxobacter sp.]
MTDLRAAVLGGLVLVGLAFLAGVRLAFERPAGRHRYLASRVSAAVLLAEVIAVAAAPVPPGRAAAAGAMLAAALALFLAAVRASRGRGLGLAFAGRLPAQLHTGGPYRLVRHPFYASYVLAFVAGGVAAWTPWVLPALAAGALTYWRAAREEEAAFLASGLAASYRAYARRVGMFVPRPPLPDGTRPSTPASSRSPDVNAG